MSLRVAVNLLYLRPGQVGGSEIYVRHLVDGLAGLGVRLRLIVPQAAAESFAGDPRLEVVVGMPGVWSQSRRLRLENTRLGQWARGCQVLFGPANFGSPLLPSLIPQVLTVHDLQHHHLKALFSPAKRAQRTAMFGASFIRARHIIAISEFTRADILSHYPVAPHRVSTILEGFDASVVRSPARERALLAQHGLRAPFFYFPGTDNAHKNHEVLLLALAQSSLRHHLVFTGSRGPRWVELWAEVLARGLQDRVHHLGFVSREAVYDLMFAADALVFPSRFEGFGLPILEAMQCGTPVIASRAASIPEVAGDAALLVAPDDDRAWAQAMARVVREPGFGQALTDAGPGNLQRFSWARCALDTLAVLERAARKR